MTKVPVAIRHIPAPGPPSCLALALALLAASPLGQAVTLIDYGADWKLWRGKKTPSRPDYWAWTKAEHDDSDWESATLPVFFGEKVTDGTELEDMKSRYNSFFLRRKFDAPDPDTVTSMTLRAKVDDGFVAYINGTEVARYNVETEKPKYTSAASKAASEPLRFRNYALKNLGEILLDGENTIAVIVLNQRRTSPDVLFDARLTAVSVESVPPKVETVDPPRGLASDLGQISVTFSEPVEGVDATDLLANDKPAQSVEGSGRTWVFQLADLPQGKVRLTWAKDHGITDQAQIPNTFRETASGSRWTYTYADNKPPYVKRSNPPAGLTVKSLDTVEVEFSMPVSGVDANDLLVNGTPAKSLTKISDSHYQFALGQAPGAEVKISWDLYPNITGMNPFKKTFLPLGWFYHVDANAPPPPRIVISEIMYHPVEEPEFDRKGQPVLDLSEDVHEFIELHNFSRETVALDNWRISGGIDYAFPAGTTVESGDFLIVAKDPKRLAAIKEYRLTGVTVLGPYEGVLSNNGERVSVENDGGNAEDSVRYSARFPWPIGADSIGAGPKWTGIDPMQYQYRGRSLERVNFSLSGGDPANWVASPLEKNATPGRLNHVARERSMPAPVVTSIRAVNSKGNTLIGKLDTVTIEARFSTNETLDDVTLEYFYDNLEKEGETLAKRDMKLKDGTWTHTLPKKPDRTLVRYRILADLGMGQEKISPRKSDPYLWHAYFVMPKFTDTRKYFELMVSRNGTSQLSKNAAANPRSGYRPAKNIKPRGPWNDTVHGILVYNGEVRDVYARWNGSFFRRNSGRNSWKVRLPRYNQFNGQSDLLFMDKDNVTVAGHTLYRELGLPTSHTEWVDVAINKRKFRRLLVEDHNDRLLENYHEDQARRNPGTEVEPNGHIFKSSGILQNLGPYGRGDGGKLGTNDGWTSLQRYEWIYSSKNQDWKGHSELKEMIDGLAKNKSNRTRLKKWFNENWDMESLMSYIAVRNWMGTWDDTVHNFYIWRRADGRWALLPWDFDNDMRNDYISRSIFIGEAGNANTTHGTHTIKDAFFKAFRTEYKEHLYHLNNTLLAPDNLSRMGLTSYTAFARGRQENVNKQCGKVNIPNQPTAQQLTGGSSVYAPATMIVGAFKSSDENANHASTLWEIRAVDSSFNYPVFKTESAGNLIEMPVPFDLLEFGRSYFWRATFIDSKGRKSLPNIEAGFRYGGHAKSENIVTLEGTEWKYYTEGKNLGTIWRKAEYDDSAWLNGKSYLGKATSRQKYKMATTLTMGATTFYFRKTFNFDRPTGGGELQMRYLVDDGAVFYLNGKQLHRVNMKERGSIRYTTRALSTVRDAELSDHIILPGEYLKQGENILAVEVHQYSTNDRDLAFGLSLSATVESLPDGVILNELMAANRGSVTHGDTKPDWIELHNPTNRDIDLAGAGLGDGVAQEPTFFFPAQTILPAKGHLVVWCDDQKESPGLHTGFALDADGQNIALWWPSAEGLKIQDAIGFGPQADDLSIGREPDGLGPWALNTPTPGLTNAKSALGSIMLLSINEWMARPENGGDWLELFNKSDSPIALAGLKLSDDPAQPDKTVMPPLTFIGPKSHLRLIADNNPEDGPTHLGFRLSSKGEEIVLTDSKAKVIDSVMFGEQTRGTSEGRFPDGDKTIVLFPNSATPGRANLILGDSDEDGLPNLWEDQYGLNPNNPADAALDTDHDGHTNYEELLAGTRPNDADSVLWLDLTVTPDSLSATFEAQPGRSYVLWTTNNPVNGKWGKVHEFQAQKDKRIISYQLPDTHLPSPNGYYRLTIPASKN
ncbi:MAG TPA: lamin tail domain-containing protein [Verrucomicrobiota bacterium]|nr:lamin tail domain-containing protein [Verrucomicrobiota bacterium]